MNRIKKLSLLLGVLLVIAGSGAFVVSKFLTNPKNNVPLVYSNNAMLLELWNAYKTNNLEAGSHRTLDKSQSNITTSEGESYTMLRAVWMDDKTTFDQSLTFTQNNLQRPSDHLFSWKFGKRADGTYGVLTDIGGQNTASDADSDIALSLLMAYSRWNQTSYLVQANQIIHSIWDQEVVTINGKPILAADDLETKNPSTVVVNPSYFAPYSYRLFGKVDPTHDWAALTDNSYNIISKLSASNLGKGATKNLPPDWIEINRQTGAFIADAASNLDTNYGYDAIRIPWRLALDYNWYKDPRDKQILQQFGYLSDEFTRTSALSAVYGHDGSVVGNYETPAMYGTALGYFKVVDPANAKKLYEQKLLTLYSPDKQTLKKTLDYYDDNWSWFGIALYQDALPNLAVNNH
jgi:endo-1,4-beta-D-glucanase Y